MRLRSSFAYALASACARWLSGSNGAIQQKPDIGTRIGFGFFRFRLTAASGEDLPYRASADYQSVFGASAATVKALKAGVPLRFRGLTDGPERHGTAGGLPFLHLRGRRRSVNDITVSSLSGERAAADTR